MSATRHQRAIAAVGLPVHVLQILHAEGVHDLGEWRRLGKRRLQIFGIVPSVVRLLDVAAQRERA